MQVGEVLIAIVGTICLFGWPIVWIACHFGHQSWKAWQELSLKREMVARGYSAQEIVQVVGAKKGSQFANTPDVPPAKPIKQPAYG
jgi:hypothetical protein